MFRDHRHHLSLIPSISGSFNMFYLKKKEDDEHRRPLPCVCPLVVQKVGSLTFSLECARVCDRATKIL